MAAWRPSNVRDGSFCQEVLEETLSRPPVVFNTDTDAPGGNRTVIF